MKLKLKKLKLLVLVPILILTSILSLLYVPGSETYHADVSGNCGSNPTGTSCPGHEHAWETPSGCSTCGGDHKISSYTTCTSCNTDGKRYQCFVCGTFGKTKNQVSHLKDCSQNNYIYIYCSICGGDHKTNESSSTCTKCYSNGTNTRCTNASWSGCGKGFYAAWSDYPSGFCYTCAGCVTTYGAHVATGTYYNTNNHWNLCAYCNGTMNTAAHSYGKEYTSGGYRYQSCACGYTKGNGAITYTIVYHGNGATSGSTAASGHTYDVGAYLTGNGYTRTGYTFLGWSTNANATTQTYNNGQAVSNLTQTHGGTVNLYAIWGPNNYKITFNANGGTNGSLSSVTTTYNTRNYYAHDGIVPSRTGYTFLGWYTAISGGVQVYQANGICTNGTGYWSNNAWVYPDNITLYAQWHRNVYTVTYNGNGGTVTTATKDNYYNEPVDLSGVKGTKNGYVFTGWNTNASAKQPLPSYTMPNGNLTLYAIYSIPISDIEGVYLVAWPTGNTNAARTVRLTRTVAQELNYTYETSNANLASITGQSSNSYAIVAYDHAGNYTVLEQTAAPPPPDWYLQTVNHYRYDAVLDDWVWFDTTSELRVYGENFTPSYLAMTPSGYRTDHIDGAYIVISDKVSSAYYKPITYTFTFEANGGTVDTTFKEVIYQDVYGELPIPEKEGYSFTGWYTDAIGGSRVSSTTKYESAENTTVYAHWEINKYNVIYDYWTNGGDSVSKDIANISYNSNADLSVSATKYGWTFVGWNTDPDATVGLNSIKIGSEDLTLYAIYKKDIVVTIYEQTDNGTVTRTMEKTIYNNALNADFTVEQVNSWTGWELLGWTTETSSDAVPNVGIGGTYQIGDNITMYALYSTDITLSYDTNGSSSVFDSQTKDRLYNAFGSYTNPVFKLVKAPVLSQSSFVGWTDENGIIYDAETEVTLEKNMLFSARWDRYPVIEAYDRYFTITQANNGEITTSELLTKVIGTDFEDGMLTNGTNVIVINYNADDFTNIDTDKEIEIIYQATDSFGNVVTKTATIYVVDTTVRQSTTSSYVRFINSHFFVNEDGTLVSSSMGGLEETSTWRTNTSRLNLLQQTLLSSRTNAETWIFKQEDIKEMKNYTNTYGHVLNAVDEFFELFSSCKQKE